MKQKNATLLEALNGVAVIQARLEASELTLDPSMVPVLINIFMHASTCSASLVRVSLEDTGILGVLRRPYPDALTPVDLYSLDTQEAVAIWSHDTAQAMREANHGTWPVIA